MRRKQKLHGELTEGKTTLEVLDYLMDQEKHANDASSRETRMRIAGFPAKKRLEDFNFDFQPSIDKAVISDLALLRFIYNAENAVFLDPPGVGKYHLAIAIGIKAVQAGLSVSCKGISQTKAKYRKISIYGISN